ncbi:hypothetical protein T484DRAFT_2519939 [Baffinella frigidus]|nr:hypothetical protein T484DRAFT_2519939 [Cryptophyta sp. CCMP2293]
MIMSMPNAPPPPAAPSGAREGGAVSLGQINRARASMRPTASNRPRVQPRPAGAMTPSGTHVAAPPPPPGVQSTLGRLRPQPVSLGASGVYLPRRLFGFNAAAGNGSAAGGGGSNAAGGAGPSEFERRQNLVQPEGSSSYGYTGGVARRSRRGLPSGAVPRRAGGGGRQGQARSEGLGSLATIAEGDEQPLQEAPTLQTKQKPVRHLAKKRMLWLRTRLMNRQRKNELQLLLPPQAANAVYAVAYMFFALCIYLILVHGLKFNGQLEVAWIIASLVAIIQVHPKS